MGDQNRSDFEKENCSPFEPYGDGRTMSYYEVPVRVLEDHDELADWIEGSRVVAASKPKKRGKRRKDGPSSRN